MRNFLWIISAVPTELDNKTALHFNFTSKLEKDLLLFTFHIAGFLVANYCLICAIIFFNLSVRFVGIELLRGQSGQIRLAKRGAVGKVMVRSLTPYIF
jgi:hypothetical protein